MKEQSRTHFGATAARVMRQVLVDHARKRTAKKRGGKNHPVPLQLDSISGSDGDMIEILELDDALQRLDKLNPRHARVVELRYFSGMTIEETAAALDVSEWTVKNDWRAARAWLMVELQSESSS